MWISKLGRMLDKVLAPVSRVSIYIGAAALVFIVSLVVVDVVLRATISSPVPGGIELVGLALMVVILAGLAHTQLEGGHIQVDVLVSRLPETLQKVITASGHILSLAVTVIISWQFFEQAEYLQKGHLVTGILGIPEWPFVVLGGILIIMFSLAILTTFCKGMAELVATKGQKVYSWLLPGIIITSGLVLLSLRPDLIGFEITIGTWTAIMVVLLFALIFLRVHIGVAMAMVALLGISYLRGPDAGLTNLSISAISIMNNYTWSVAPLFAWMGLLVLYAGFAEELYDAAYKWIGRLPGGLASATTAACAGLAAIVGDTMTGVFAMGTIALPEMRTYKYDMKLATATICAAATIGMMIPPSLGFIIYGMMTEVSIGKLFIAGIFPGLLLMTVLITLITIRCSLNPALGPRGGSFSWKARVVSLKNVWAVVILVMLCLGGIYAGIFTPTEAGSIGAAGALTLALIGRRISRKNFILSLKRQQMLTAALLFIFVFAMAFSYFIAVTNLPHELALWISGLGLSPYAIIGIILLIYMILGCLMNALPAVMLTLPIFFPIAMTAGFDPIWFGVLIVLMVELGVLTPPIGMNVFAMATVARDVPMYSIFKGILPYWGAFIIVAIILVAFPQISLFLPSLMG